MSKSTSLVKCSQSTVLRYFANKQTERQTERKTEDKRRLKHNLKGGSIENPDFGAPRLNFITRTAGYAT